MLRSIMRFLSNGDVKLIINNNDIHIYDGYDKYLNNKNIIERLNYTLYWDNLRDIITDRYANGSLSDTNVKIDGDKYIWYLNDSLFSKECLKNVIKYVLDKLAPDDEEVELVFTFTVISYWCFKEVGRVTYNKILDTYNDEVYTEFDIIWE